MDRASIPRVVIVGGGFGGLSAAKALRNSPVTITLVDARNHHLFQPLLYQVATAALTPSEIARPIRRILRHQKNVEVILGEAVAIDTASKIVKLADGELSYDYLIIASGATHSYFGHDEWEPDAPGLKTIEDATEIRRRFLIAYEAAERESDEIAIHEWMSFAIVGAGPTGVELAGALSELARRVLAADFRHINTRHARVVLLEGAPRILPAMAPESSESASRQLKKRGVEVMTSTMVTGIDARGVSHKNGRIPTRTVIWAAGVAASPIGKSLGVPLDRAGRVIVSDDLSVPGAPNVFVIGDLASIKQPDGRPVPGLAPAAMQMGRHAAHNVARAAGGQDREPFRYRDKGTLATIGRGAAVAEIGRLRLRGFIAWMAWLLIHIFYLIGFRNRFLVLAEWAWVYLRNESGSRLITGDVEPLLERGKPKHEPARRATPH
ncbi:MAG TPA: NAD(P)/FAD-dependent oxidoreductase [Candidatus Binataceae bacterium]|nr:NAD(P)/FAD-dependent oxidoreductase [Candidatus Binataceae bacterium]